MLLSWLQFQFFKQTVTTTILVIIIALYLFNFLFLDNWYFWKCLWLLWMLFFLILVSTIFLFFYRTKTLFQFFFILLDLLQYILADFYSLLEITQRTSFVQKDLERSFKSLVVAGCSWDMNFSTWKDWILGIHEFIE